MTRYEINKKVPPIMLKDTITTYRYCSSFSTSTGKYGHTNTYRPNITDLPQTEKYRVPSYLLSSVYQLGKYS